MKIIVTGSAGFIGSHLVDYLVDHKHFVYGIDDLSGGFRRNINSKSKFYKLDLRSKNKTILLIKKLRPDIIYHLAADATEGRSQFTPLTCTERNYSTYLNVLVGAIGAKVKKIVVTSSMSVYGNQSPPFSEMLDRKPVDIYGIAKTAMEEATEVMSKVYRIEYTIVRPHNVYGPRQNIADPYRNVIGIFINRLLLNKNLYIYGDGSQKRSFSYIDDVVPSLANAGTNINTNGQIINIGPSAEHTINQIAKIIQGYFSKDKKNTSIGKPIYLPDRPQEVKNAYCTDLKARQILQFKPTTSLEDGIRKTIIWAKRIGAQKFRYIKLELISPNTPTTWTKRLL